MVIRVSHPVHAVLSLILSFVSACVLMMRLQIEFMSLIFIVVYVGAIAVLFLFVVMMLDLNSLGKQTSSSYGNKNSALSLFLIASLIIFMLVRGNNNPIFSSPNLPRIIKSKSYVEWVERMDQLNSLETIGQILYTTKFVYLIMAGFVLLVARVGAIVLTLQVRSFALAKRQQVHQQRARKSTNALMMTRYV